MKQRSPFRDVLDMYTDAVLEHVKRKLICTEEAVDDLREILCRYSGTHDQHQAALWADDADKVMDRMADGICDWRDGAVHEAVDGWVKAQTRRDHR